MWSGDVEWRCAVEMEWRWGGDGGRWMGWRYTEPAKLKGSS